PLPAASGWLHRSRLLGPFSTSGRDGSVIAELGGELVKLTAQVGPFLSKFPVALFEIGGSIRSLLLQRQVGKRTDHRYQVAQLLLVQAIPERRHAAPLAVANAHEQVVRAPGLMPGGAGKVGLVEPAIAVAGSRNVRTMTARTVPPEERACRSMAGRGCGGRTASTRAPL